MRIELAFGKTGLSVELPEGPRYEILQARSATPLKDVRNALAFTLDHPIGTPALEELARGKNSAAISVCDITRPAPNPVTLPPLLERLHAGGIPKAGVTILIATGLHRPATPEEIAVIVGPAIAAEYRVVNHYAKDLASHAALGTTRRGTPVFIDERFVSADLHITLGFIEQHLMAGFSGGRKLVAPGLAAQETIKVLHSPPFMREPKAVEGSIEGNPLHAELLEIAALARHDFILDVALAKTREIAGIFAGNAVKAHAEGVAFLQKTLLASVPEPVDAVITTAAGYPLDLTFYQTIKGVTAAQHILKPGGKILVMSACSEGVGAPEFANKLAGLTSYSDYLNELDGAPVEVDQWQLEKLALAGGKFEVLFYTPGISPRMAGGLADHLFPTPEAAVRALMHSLPANARIAVIPEGPHAFTQLSEYALV
ncbi:MAG TPA: nickel-dependent lactate racemase [Bryobacteraceae bacterium]|nr:nickel-dependent lactate racemase [Bryobacteraceae bacterium]